MSAANPSSAPSRRFAASRRSRAFRRSFVDPDGDVEYTTSLTDLISPTLLATLAKKNDDDEKKLREPVFNTVHTTLDGSPSAKVERVKKDRHSSDLQERPMSHPQPDRTSLGAVRKRRKRISRRLASPRSVLMGTGNYLISPWTTDLDEVCENKNSSSVMSHKRSTRTADPRWQKSPRQDETDMVNGDGLPRSGLRRRRRSRSSLRYKDMGSEPSLSATDSMIDLRSETNRAFKEVKKENNKEEKDFLSFAAFRITYLIVHIAIMLSDGLQGTHLYVLYEGYGYSVASLYCLGFVSGAFTSPFIGPFVDKVGRKKCAVMYCALEIFINLLEQYDNLAGLIISRVIGGITTNLLFSVFESWLVTEHRRRGYAEEKLETILRDSVIVSNLAAIASGWLAHTLASWFGPVGPFEGAVTCIVVALVLVVLMWTENHGCANSGSKTIKQYMAGAFKTIVSDSKICRIGLIQGLSEGSLQTFVFLWSPALRHFSSSAPPGTLGLDDDGEPAYGLIFGAFMACGVVGGLAEPSVRKVFSYFVCDDEGHIDSQGNDSVVMGNAEKGEDEEEVKPAAVEFLTSAVYLASAALLLTPYLLHEDNPHAFSISLAAFLVYEFMVGLYMPCEGVIRSIYMPTSSICSLMTMLRVIVNVAVAVGVVSTNYVPFATAFASLSMLMVISFALQLSLVSVEEWSCFVRGLGLGPWLAKWARKSREVTSSFQQSPQTGKIYVASFPSALNSSVFLESHEEETSGDEDDSSQCSGSGSS